jgi:RNA polymerase sigma factor (sigma-70 family)
MNDEKVIEFNEFFIKEYQYLMGFSKSINPQSDYESLLHDCYLRCRDRIEINGYEGTNYMNFMRVTIMNTFKSNYRNLKKRQIIDIENQNYYNTIEDILLQKEEQQEQEIEAIHQNEYLTTMIYEYVDNFYNQKENYIFKTYFILKHRHLNYKQLAQATGYSITSVSNVIKRIKKDLRKNIYSYIITGYTESYG